MFLKGFLLLLPTWQYKHTLTSSGEEQHRQDDLLRCYFVFYSESNFLSLFKKEASHFLKQRLWEDNFRPWIMPGLPEREERRLSVFRGIQGFPRLVRGEDLGENVLLVHPRSLSKGVFLFPNLIGKRQKQSLSRSMLAWG